MEASAKLTKNQNGAIKETFLEFRDYSSIHGVKYMFANNLPFWSRIIWGTSFTLALACCVVMTIHSLREFYDSPIMHTLETYHSVLSAARFPAVTICNANRFQISRARRFVDSLKIPESVDMNRSAVFEALPHLAAMSSADIANININLETAYTLQKVLDFNHVSMRDAYSQLYQPCSQLLERCRWEGRSVACGEFFERQLTFQGYCCSFNYALSSQHPPRRNIQHGTGTGLTVTLNVASHDALPGTAVGLGVKVVLHENADFPDVARARAYCGAGLEWLINLEYVEHVNGGSLRELTIQQRQCLFEDEIEPFFDDYPTYSPHNCQLVHRVEKSVALCGCVGFFIPKAIVKLETALHSGCLQTCNHVQFYQSIHIGNLGAAAFHNHDSYYEDANLTDRTVIHTYFGAQLTTKTRANISYSLYALMALSGGYCSLFLGCSFLSGLEIVYFSTFRLLRRFLSKTELWKPQHLLICKRPCPRKINNAKIKQNKKTRGKLVCFG